MGLKGTLYDVAAFVWAGLMFGTWISVDLGYTEPWLSFSDIPGGSTGAFAVAFGVTIAGWYVVGKLKDRHGRADWQEMGRQAGLRPSDDPGDRIVPELAGTVDGRTVTASYDIQKESIGDGGTTRVTYSYGGAELTAPADEGVIVGPAGERVSVRNGIGTFDFEDIAETASTMEGLVAAETGNLVLVGTSEAAVEAVAAGVSGDALRAFTDLQIVSIGDASGVVADVAETHNEEMEGIGSSWAEYPVDNLVEGVPGDAATVTVETRTAIRDSDYLRRFTEGVVAIADAFEEATAHTPAAG